MSKSEKDEIGSSQNNSKEEKISELRFKLESLKKHSKEYESLNANYKKLLNDFSLMNEAKNRLEYEIKQRESEYNRRISDLKAENETLKLGLNDKMTSSVKINTENDTIEREIALKNEEIIILNEKLNEISEHYQQYCQSKNDLVDLAQNIHNELLTQNEQLFKLKEDNKFLTKICQENEKNLRLGENDIHKLSNQINEYNYDVQNLNKKIILHENNVNKLQKKLNSNNDINLSLQNNIKKMEKEFDNYRNENEILKNEIIKERTLRINIEENNERLNNILIQKERELNQINNENEYIKLMNTQYKKNKDINNKLNDRLKNQAVILENQNNILINEIDNILYEDRKMKEIINRRERINYLLKNNNDNLEKSVNGLDNYIINKYRNNYQTNNARITYHYYDNQNNF